MIKKSILKGIIAATLLFTFYLIVVSLLSDWVSAKQQLAQFWYYVVFLAAGFGTQIGLYSYMKSLHCSKMPKGVLATSSTSSILAMISCCAHYLINIIPILGITGFVSVVNKYQTELFQIGLIFSILGILYMARQVRKLTYNYDI